MTEHVGSARAPTRLGFLGTKSPPPLDDGWQTGTPEDVGLKRRPLEQMTEALRRGDYPNVHALLINKDGRLVYEEYFTGTDSRWHGGHREDVSLVFDRDTLHDVRSVSKSITSALVGIALGPDAVDSLDRPLIDFFPADTVADTHHLRHIALRHALTMSAGLDWNEEHVPHTNPANHETAMLESADPAGFVLARPVVTEPGFALELQWWPRVADWPCRQPTR